MRLPLLTASSLASLLTLLSAAGSGCMPVQPAGSAELALSARPVRVAADGTPATLLVQATDAKGLPGQGEVTFIASLGTIAATAAVPLAADGTASTTWRCDARTQTGCAPGLVKLSAQWNSGTEQVTTSAMLTLLAVSGDGGTPDGGAPVDAGPALFPCVLGPGGGDSLDVDLLADWSPWTTPGRLLVANEAKKSLDVLDVTTGEAVQRVLLGVAPARLAADPASGLAAVAYGASGPARLDLVDVGTGAITPVSLTVGATDFHGLDVTLAPGVAWVLASHVWSTPWDVMLVEVDLTTHTVRGARTARTFALTSSASDPRLSARGAVLFTGTERLAPAAPDAGWDFESTLSFTSAWDLPSHLAASADGGSILYGTSGDLATEYSANPPGAVLRQFPLLPGNGPDALDIGWSHAGHRIALLDDVGGELWVQVFAHATGGQLRAGHVGGWAAHYDRRWLTFASDDSAVYVYAATTYGAVTSRILCLRAP